STSTASGPRLAACCMRESAGLWRCASWRGRPRHMQSLSRGAVSRRTGTAPSAAPTSIWRCDRTERARQATTFASRSLDGDAGPLGPRDSGLADTHPDRHPGQRHDQRIGSGRGERLEQPVSVVPRDPLHDIPHDAIVGGRLDRILARLGPLERDIDEERLPGLALVLVDPVTAENLEPVHLHDHPATASATFSASTCSSTSWARMIVAPWSYAVTAAARLAESGPVVAPGSPRMRPSELLREKPTTTGRPSAVRTPSR